jgi:hypothetical protein
VGHFDFCLGYDAALSAPIAHCMSYFPCATLNDALLRLTMTGIIPPPSPPRRRDIRSDLEDRIGDATINRDRALAQAKEYEDDIALLKRMLDRENARYQRAINGKPKPTLPLDAFIEQHLKMRPMNKNDLWDYADKAGYDVDGRSIHATTMNLLRGGRIKEFPAAGSGVYAVADYDPAQYELRDRV